MRLIARYPNGNEIWAVEEAWGTDYWVYGYYDSGDPKVCPSIDMARTYAA